ncbi:MAG: hypothetical protein HC899_32425 [Leptolyngbyaceae cyanobacterium SM1_4_3]|nr:hypothetical protein [Leptolyngbyaceae cyanobacterium SM1_4_3]
MAQLDFSATPKDNKGLLFKHIVCDTPLGEAVDAGIVKTPLIGQASRKLVEQADDKAKTLFNLVTCNRELEVAVAKFCDRAPDVTAFAKNAGSQCLRIDYLANGDRLAFYTPDFFLRTTDGHYYLVEPKGREDRDVPLKAKAAIAWCDAASSETVQWHYLYIPQGVFERMAGDTIAELARACPQPYKIYSRLRSFKTCLCL